MTLHNMNPKITRILVSACFGALLPATVPLLAQQPVASSASESAGTINGRVFNPASGEYIRNAQVTVHETGQSVVSEAGGTFRIWPVTPGRHTVTVTYTGYKPASAIVEVAPGGTAVRDFDLVSTLQDEAGGPVVQLSAFTVLSEREGNAKAIMDQRSSMNITNTVASDVFGDNAEGNIGEFLKHLPGVDISTAFGEVRNVGLRGLGSEYTAVTVDGMSLSSADPTSQSASNSRAFTFENVSLSSMDSIEVSKTVSADMDANAPAGTINLRTKRAFERAGRRISWQANLTGHSEELHFRKTMGPDERESYKLRPGGMLEYSDVFFNKRLGVVFSVSESNLYQEANVTTLTYNRATTAADQRPQVITQLQFNQAVRFNERFATTLNADFKATDNLVLSLGVIYNWSELWNPQRSALFNTGARNTVVGADPTVSFTTSASNAFAAGRPTNVAKLGQTTSLLPKFEYKWKNLTVEGRFAFSRSYAWYDPMGRQLSAQSLNAPSTVGVRFRAERPSADSYDWAITQTAGPDFATGYTNSPPAIINDFRSSRRNIYGGEISATLKTSRVHPVTWKAGVKTQYELYTFANFISGNLYNYTPGGGASPGWNSFKSPYQHELGMTGLRVASLSGGNIFMPDLLAIGRQFADRPQDFTHTMTPAQYTTVFITSPRRYEETIDASYLMGTTKLGKATVRAGLRWEETSGDATELAQRSPADVRAAGFAVGADGRATSIPGLEYQYFSLPRAHRISKYDNLFPSASLKYNFTRHLDLHLGYSSTIRRPAFKDIAGFFNINEQTRIVSAPNINLQPETSDNLSARLAYYFEPVGIVAVNVFQNNVENLMIDNTVPAAEYGYSGPEDLTGYEIKTTTNSPGVTKIRGWELEYFQSLSFLPGALRGLGLRASYTHNYAQKVVPGLSRHKVSGGISYSYLRFSANLNALWDDDIPLAVNQTSYRRHRATLDLSAAYRITARTGVFVSARNLTNSRYVTMEHFAPNPAVWRAYELYGTTWTFGVKGTF